MWTPNQSLNWSLWYLISLIFDFIPGLNLKFPSFCWLFLIFCCQFCFLSGSMQSYHDEWLNYVFWDSLVDCYFVSMFSRDGTFMLWNCFNKRSVFNLHKFSLFYHFWWLGLESDRFRSERRKKTASRIKRVLILLQWRETEREKNCGRLQWWSLSAIGDCAWRMRGAQLIYIVILGLVYKKNWFHLNCLLR